MSFADFESMDLETFLRTNSSATDLWIFLHIPKTAGSSFSSEIALRMPPYRNIHVDYDNRARPYNEQLQLAVDRFLAEAKYTRFRSASGHVPFDLLNPVVKSLPGARVVTMLRDPVTRVLSDYRYQRTPAHPPFKEFIEQFPSFDSYVEAPASQNKMFSFLAPRGSGRDFDAAYVQIQRDLAFIGLLELYDMSFNIVFRLFGLGDHMPVEHQRRTETTPDNRVDLTPELIAKIKSLNSLDVQLFDRVRTTLLGRRAAWMALRTPRGLDGGTQSL